MVPVSYHEKDYAILSSKKLKMGQIFHLPNNKFSWMESPRKILPTLFIWLLKASNEEEFEERKMENTVSLAYVEEMDYWAQSLVILSDKAKEIKNPPFKKFMTTDGRRLFVIEVPIDYPRSQEQIEQAKKLP
jgi:hypothetical protein